jgi:hypothetical protein
MWLMAIVVFTIGDGDMEHAARAGQWQIVPEGFIGLRVLRDEAPLFKLESHLVGPDWARTRMQELARVDQQGHRVYAETLGFRSGPWYDQTEAGDPVAFRYEAFALSGNTLRLQYRCSAEKEAPLEGVGLFVPASDFLTGGAGVAIMADCTSQEFPLPPPGQGTVGETVNSMVLKAPSGEKILMRFSASCLVNYHHEQLRAWPLSGGLSAGQSVERTVTIEFPRPIAFEAENRYVKTSDWFPLRIENDHSPGSAIGMEDWLDKPAGRHGWVGMDGDRFVFEDGTPAKFWGINICVELVAPSKEDADLWAERCAKYGANLVRMHKFIRHMRSNRSIAADDDSTKLDEPLARKWDYFNAALARRGIYTGWSAYYAFQLSPADRERVWAYDEIMNHKQGAGWFHGSTIGLVNFAPDLQDIHIKAMVNLLNRTNTVTGRRYADDPSLAYIELQNEDDIFFYQCARIVEKCPTYRRYINGEFSDWLQERYGTRGALAESWGEELKEDESFEERNIAAFPPEIFSSTPSRRVIETYRFLFEQQDAYYRRMVRAIRDTGYQGAICGSCWQAATWLGHLYNVYSDYRVGYIDRHNYGGGPMIRRPGSGLLSAGMQAVIDRPFGLSEWAGRSVFGSGDAAAIIGIYGTGLQGWDLSAHFASNSPRIEGQRRASCDQFVNIAQYPAIARMLYRGDLREGDIVANRRISLPGLFKGDIGFTENFSLLGGANIKEFSSVVPQASLAAGRVVLQFVDGPVDDPIRQNVGPYLDEQSRTVRSTTGQLKWDYSGRGFFTVDTPGTQGVVGFGGGRSHELSEVTIDQQSPFACLYVSARDPDEIIAEADAILISAVGRAMPEGTVTDESSQTPMVRGDGPLLVEPVRATITLKRDEPCRVYALDHDGRRPADAVELPVTKTPHGRRFTIDGAKHKATYYVVDFGQ